MDEGPEGLPDLVGVPEQPDRRVTVDINNLLIILRHLECKNKDLKKIINLLLFLLTQFFKERFSQNV